MRIGVPREIMEHGPCIGLQPLTTSDYSLRV